MGFLLCIRFLALAVFFSFLTFAQEVAIPRAAESTAPEMEKLSKVLAGDWTNTETMERSRFFPNGGERHGTSHCALETDGTALVCAGQSDGSAAS